MSESTDMPQIPAPSARPLHWALLLGLCLPIMAASAGVSAQQTSAIMPTIGGHREVPRNLRMHALGAATELLRTEELIVLTDDRVRASLDATALACQPGAPCASGIRGILGVDLLVGLVLWGTSEDPSRPDSVRASLLDGSGGRYVGSTTLDPDTAVEQALATAVRDALRSALRDQRRGPGPFLQIRGTRGASVELDGAAVGTVPLTTRVEPGHHELRLTLEGHQTQSLDVSVGPETAETTEVEVELQPRMDGGLEEATGYDVIANASLAGGLGVAGIVLLAINPIPTLAQLGECDESEPGGRCTGKVRFELDNGVLLGLGAALVAASVTVAIVGPFRQPLQLGASASSERVGLSLSGSF